MQSGQRPSAQLERRLLDAQQRADAEGAELAARGLEQRIRSCFAVDQMIPCAGQGALAGFTAANFDIAVASAVPEPGTLVLALPALALCGLAAGARRTRRDAASRPGSEG